jgi:hypothetical protein
MWKIALPISSSSGRIRPKVAASPPTKKVSDAVLAAATSAGVSTRLRPRALARTRAAGTGGECVAGGEQMAGLLTADVADADKADMHSTSPSQVINRGRLCCLL